MPAPVLQFKRGNAGVAGTVPALRPGEPAISLNNFDFFIGIDTSVANNKFFGSHRYWEREQSGVKSLKLKLVSDNGSESINLRAPVSLGATFTYTLPATAIGYSGKVLSTNGDGDLSWVDQVNTLGVEQIVIGIGTFTNNVAFTTTTVSTSSTTGAVVIAGGLGVGGTSYFGEDVNVGGDLSVTGITSLGSGGFLDVNSGADFAGITTFSNTTDNALGDVNTGAVQIDGGVGIAKNLTVGAGLSVAGQSYFIGTATFYGGTINLGDGGDVINIDGSINSNLVPTIDATYDVGISTLNWRNAHFSGIGTFESGVKASNVNIGVGEANTINTLTGKLSLDSAIGIVEIPNNLEVLGDIDVQGNVYIGGTTVTLRAQDVFIENKDIVLGYTTSVTPNDTTANHAGVAIASTEGSPLVSFTASGINTLPDTYKQMMWFKSGTLGFSTDVFAFNYGVAIGTTTMADGVRLAVGSSITMTDDTITAPVGNFGTLSGSLTGTISTATRATTVDTTTAPNGTYYPGLFVSSTGIASTSVYVDAGISYDSNTNALTLDGDLAVNGGDLTTTATEFNLVNANATTVNFAGAATNLVIGSTSGITTISNDLTVGGDVRINGSDIKASDGNTNITLTSNTLTAFAGDIKVGGNDIQASDGNVNITMTSNTLTEVKGDLQITGNEIKSSTTQTVITLSANDATFADNVNIIGVTTTAQLTIGTGVAVTQFSASVSTGNSTSSVPTSSAIIDYVGTQIGAVDLTFGIAGDTGTSSVNTSQTFNILGTANEIETAASAQTITIGLPNDVIVGTSLSAPTIKTATIQHSNGNQAATIDVSGNIVASQNLTVTGNLFVNGSTTQVNTETLTVEDRLIEAGKVQNTPPSDSTWDVGILFNYYKSNANKRAGVFWDDSVSRLAFAAETSVSNDSGTASTDPLVSVTTWAPIEVGSLWVNDCAGQSQVISCTGTERFLENITVDAGTF